MTQHDNELYLIMGRLEGKVDALTNVFSTTANRLDAAEARLTTAEASIAGLQATGATQNTWFSNLVAIAAAGIAALSLYLGVRP